MPSYNPPIKGVEYIFSICLISQADPKKFQVNPTLAAGDVKISKDNGTLNNLTTLPVVTPASSTVVKVTVSATEMDADNVDLVFIDAAGAEWCDTHRNIQPTYDTYQAKVWLTDDDTGSNDRYEAAWFKNGMPVLSGITSPTIQVVKAADGTDLVASTAMTQIASTGVYRYNEATNRIVDGVAYFIKVQATIDGTVRTWIQPVGRDS